MIYCSSKVIKFYCGHFIAINKWTIKMDLLKIGCLIANK